MKEKKNFGGAVWFDISFDRNAKKPGDAAFAEKRLKKAFKLIKKSLSKNGFQVGERLFNMDFYVNGDLLWCAE